MGEILSLSPLKGDRYVLLDDWNGIPKGFVTDGASIPRAFWRVIDHPFRSDYIDIYTEHDYDYQTGRIPREEADEKMLEGLKERGMGIVKRYTIYRAVRIFGASHYNNKNKEKK